MRSQTRNRTLCNFLILGLLLAAQATSAAGNKKLVTIKKAKVMAQRAIVESVVGLKIRSESLFANQPSDYNQIQSKVSASIKGIMFDTPKYDTQKDIAMVTAKIRLGSIKTVIGKPIHYDNVVISRVGFGTSSREFQPQLSSLRAAELSAYDEMAQLLVGQKLQSKTTVKDFVLESDEVRTKTLAALWGSEVKDYGWQEDGTAYVTLRLNAKWVKDILGQTTAFGDDNYLEATGYGAMEDNLHEEESFGQQGVGVEETSFDIPGASNSGNNEGGGGASVLH